MSEYSNHIQSLLSASESDSVFFPVFEKKIISSKEKESQIPSAIKKYFTKRIVKLYDIVAGNEFYDIEFHQRATRMGYVSLTKEADYINQKFVDFLGPNRSKDPYYWRTLGHMIQTLRLDAHYNRTAGLPSNKNLPIWFCLPNGKRTDLAHLRKYIGTARSIEAVYEFLENHMQWMTVRKGSESSELTTRFQSTELFKLTDQAFRNEKSHESIIFKFHRLNDESSPFYIKDLLFDKNGDPNVELKSSHKRFDTLLEIRESESKDRDIFSYIQSIINNTTRKKLDIPSEPIPGSEPDEILDYSSPVNNLVNDHVISLCPNDKCHLDVYDLDTLCSSMLGDPQELTVLKNQGKFIIPPSVLLTKRHLKRRDVDFDIIPECFQKHCSRVYTYGRFHSPIQSLRKGVRADLLIDGVPTCEVDISGSHLSILYAIARKPLHGDKYDLNSKVLQIKYPKYLVDGRALGKEVFVRALNSKSRASAINSIRRMMKDADAIAWSTYDPEEVLSRLEELNPDVKEFFYKELGLDVMYVESKISEKIIETLSNNNIPCIHLHDSWIAPEKNTQNLLDAIRTAYEAVLNWKDIFIKIILPHQNTQTRANLRNTKLLHETEGSGTSREEWTGNTWAGSLETHNEPPKQQHIPLEGHRLNSGGLCPLKNTTKPYLDNRSIIEATERRKNDPMLETAPNHLRTRIANLCKALQISPDICLNRMSNRSQFESKTLDEVVSIVEIEYSDYGSKEAAKKLLEFTYVGW